MQTLLTTICRVVQRAVYNLQEILQCKSTCKISTSMIVGTTYIRRNRIRNLNRRRCESPALLRRLKTIMRKQRSRRRPITHQRLTGRAKSESQITYLELVTVSVWWSWNSTKSQGWTTLSNLNRTRRGFLPMEKEPVRSKNWRSRSIYSCKRL